MGCAEKHNKMKVGYVKVDTDYKGMWEQIITNDRILQGEQIKLSFSYSQRSL